MRTTASGSMSICQNDEIGACRAETIAALITAAWLTASVCPARRCWSFIQSDTRSHIAAMVSPPCGASIGRVIQAASASARIAGGQRSTGRPSGRSRNRQGAGQVRRRGRAPGRLLGAQGRAGEILSARGRRCEAPSLRRRHSLPAVRRAESAPGDWRRVALHLWESGEACHQVGRLRIRRGISRRFMGGKSPRY